MARYSKLRSDNQTGIAGVQKFKHEPRLNGRKKRKTRLEKWVVRCQDDHICMSYSLEDAALKRYEAELKINMFADPTESTAYQYLLKHNLLLEGK